MPIDFDPLLSHTSCPVTGLVITTRDEWCGATDEGSFQLALIGVNQVYCTSKGYSTISLTNKYIQILTTIASQRPNPDTPFVVI